MLDPSTRLRKSSTQVSCTLNDEIAILSLEKSVYFGLEGVGAQLWQALDQPCTVADLCKLIVETYEVTPEQCEADVLRFLQSMRDAGLVETVN
jgi:hypothetical protein